MGPASQERRASPSRGGTWLPGCKGLLWVCTGCYILPDVVACVASFGGYGFGVGSGGFWASLAAQQVTVHHLWPYKIIKPTIP